MKRFEYAQPQSEREAVELLNDAKKETAILAGGTDLVGLMKRMVATPDRVVNIREIDSLRRIEADDDGNVWIGAAVCLDEFVDDRATDQFPSAKMVIQGISSIQLQVARHPGRRTAASTKVLVLPRWTWLDRCRWQHGGRRRQSLPRDFGQSRAGKVCQCFPLGPRIDFDGRTGSDPGARCG